MPVVLSKSLPAYQALRNEGVEVLPAGHDVCRDRPLRVAVLNLMPEKPITEVQVARLLGESAYCIEPAFFLPDGHRAKTTSASHIAAHYERWSNIRRRRFDGLIVTGAPVELLPFEDVTYWHELTTIFDWARSRAVPGLYICWAAQAALWHFHGVRKRRLPAKMFGVFAHRVAAPQAPLMKGLAQGFPVPVSRHTEVAAADLPKDRGLQILADSDESGLCLVQDTPNRATYMFNHLEYDADTLAREYWRDLRAGASVPAPRNYFPDDDPGRAPVQSWRGSARILFRNWLHEVRGLDDARDSETRQMDWLFGRAGPSAVGARHTDFRIDADEPLAVVPSVLQVLAGLRLSPVALKTDTAADSGCTITLRVSAIGGADAEGAARQILENVTQVRRAAYRDSGGDGGLLIAGRASGHPRPARAIRTKGNAA